MPSKGNKCCCGGSSSPSVSPSPSPSASPEEPTYPDVCCIDSVRAAEYSFTMTGSTNIPASGCFSCSAVNGNWTVSVTVAGTYKGPLFNSCSYFFGETEWEWRLFFECVDLVPPIGTDTMRVTLVCEAVHGPAPFMVSYKGLFPIPMDCLSPFVLDKFGEGGVNCTGFPATVTVSPV